MTNYKTFVTKIFYFFGNIYINRYYTLWSQGRQEHYAKRIVKAMKDAEAKGLGATSFEGRMIDIAVLRQAEDLVALADLIAKKEKK